MKKFIIVTDSCSDLDAKLRAEYDIEYIPMHFSFDGKDFDADLDWKKISVKEFYDVMRSGTRIITAQVSAREYKEKFSEYLKEGFDILSISCSSALSASVKASYVARDELMAEYPDRKIICIDSLISCGGLAMICVKAAQLRAEGKSIDEVAEWVEANKLCFNQEATVDKLVYLRQAGRISASSALYSSYSATSSAILS
jgi:DegV family protein with EDD domain